MKTFRKSGSARGRPCPAALLAVALPLLSVPGIRAAAQAPAPCCFTNPAYNGICLVKPGDQETCKSVLEYLNNPNSSGKTYCGGSTIRGGWKEVKCPQTADPKRGRNSLIDPLGGPACRAPGAIAARAFQSVCAPRKRRPRPSIRLVRAARSGKLGRHQARQDARPARESRS